MGRLTCVEENAYTHIWKCIQSRFFLINKCEKKLFNYFPIKRIWKIGYGDHNRWSTIFSFSFSTEIVFVIKSTQTLLGGQQSPESAVSTMNQECQLTALCCRNRCGWPRFRKWVSLSTYPDGVYVDKLNINTVQCVWLEIRRRTELVCFVLV